MPEMQTEDGPPSTPPGMRPFMVTFQDETQNPDAFVIAHSQQAALDLAEEIRGADPHGAYPAHGTAGWEPRGVPRDQWYVNDVRPAVSIEGFVHDPENTKRSLILLLKKISDELDKQCPECGRSYETARGSMELVFEKGEVIARHKRGCCRFPVAVSWRSEAGVYAPDGDE